MYYFNFSWCLNYRNTKNSYILQAKYQPHSFDKARYFEASWFSIKKYGMSSSWISERWLFKLENPQQASEMFFKSMQNTGQEMLRW